MDAQTEIVGISTDDSETQKGFCEKTAFPGVMLSDTDYKVSQLYGVFNEGGKYSRRVYFIVDKKGVVRFVKESMLPMKNKELLSEIAKINKEKPAGTKKGVPEK